MLGLDALELDRDLLARDDVRAWDTEDGRTRSADGNPDEVIRVREGQRRRSRTHLGRCRRSYRCRSYGRYGTYYQRANPVGYAICPISHFRRTGRQTLRPRKPDRWGRVYGQSAKVIENRPHGEGMRGFGGSWQVSASGDVVLTATPDGRGERRTVGGQRGEQIDSPWSSS